MDSFEPKDDRHGRTRTSTFGQAAQAINELHRRNTVLTSQTLYSDPSSKIWGLYLSQAERIDKEHSDSWTANTDGVLVFVRHNHPTRFYCSHPRGTHQTGLFSAVVATFLVVSYPLLQPNSTDTTNRLLTQISQQLASNGTGSSQPSSPANNPPFSPPASAVRVNTLWFTSLAFSTACALWATLMQQWTRRYLQVADRPYAPPKRARIRAFFADGVERFAFAAAVEVLPALLHASVLLFYAGLVDFLININHTVAYSLLAWVAIGFLIYFILSIMPLFYPNSPYQTPLSSFCWFVMEAAPLLKLWLRRRNDTVRAAISDRKTKIGQGMRRALESKAIGHTSRDTNALRWTLGSLDEDHELEEFLDGLPGLFHGSEHHHSVGLRGGLEQLVQPVADKLFTTCTTGFLPEEPRRQRLTVCLRAIWCFSGTTDRHFRAIQDRWDKVTNDPWGPLSPETWVVALDMTTDLDPFTTLRAHCIQALMAVMWRKGGWQCTPPEAAALLQRQLGVSSVDIDRWLASGDQLQLAVAADLLSKSLPLLRKLDELGIGADMLKQLKAILDTICGELDVSDVPHELRARFADRVEVMNVFRHASFELSGPWTKIFTPTPWP